MTRSLTLLAAFFVGLGARCGTQSPPPTASTTVDVQVAARDAAHDVGAPDVGARQMSVRLVALGDSFTIGTGSSPAEAFPARLVARWTGLGCQVELSNPARNGFTTQDLLDDELPVVRPFAPTLVTLAVGANDIVRGRSLDEYRAQLRRIFDALSDAGVAGSRVIALPQPDWARSPVSAGFGDPDALHAQIVAFNHALRDEARVRGATWVDLFPLMMEQARTGQIASDGLHPDARAHDAWAAELTRQLPMPCGP